MDYLLPETSKFAPSSTVLPLSSPYGGSAEGDGDCNRGEFSEKPEAILMRLIARWLRHAFVHAPYINSAVQKRQHGADGNARDSSR